MTGVAVAGVAAVLEAAGAEEVVPDGACDIFGVDAATGAGVSFFSGAGGADFSTMLPLSRVYSDQQMKLL